MLQSSVCLLLICTVLDFVTCQITSSYPSLPTNTGTPGGPGTNLLNYPQCAQECGNTYQPVADCPRPPATPDPACDCGPIERGATSPCEAQTCNDADFLKAQQLSQDLCAPIYAANASLASAASAAIASATSAALAVETIDSTDITNFPPCTQKCLPAALNASGCTSQSDRNCLCHCSLFVDSLAPCEFATCSSQELSFISYLSNNLCLPAGGQLPKNLDSCRKGNISATGTGLIGNGTPAVPTGAINPSITPFKGTGIHFAPEILLVVLGGVLGFGAAL